MYKRLITEIENKFNCKVAANYQQTVLDFISKNYNAKQGLVLSSYFNEGIDLQRTSFRYGVSLDKVTSLVENCYEKIYNALKEENLIMQK